MIKHLSGDYETVEYEEKRCIMLYHNTQYEEYPVHWHQEIEIIIRCTSATGWRSETGNM